MIEIEVNSTVFNGNMGRVEFGEEKHIPFNIVNKSNNIINIVNIESTYPDTSIEGILGELEASGRTSFNLIWAPASKSLGVKREGKIEVDYEEYV